MLTARRLARRIRPCQEAAVENHALAGHERRTIGAHPDYGFGDLRRLSEATDWMAIDNVLVNRRGAKQSLAHRGFDYSRTDCVDSNSALGGFERGGFRQADDSMFARAVGRCVGAPTKPVTEDMFTMAPAPPCLSI